jgi:hypothetical protein
MHVAGKTFSLCHCEALVLRRGNPENASGTSIA